MSKLYELRYYHLAAQDIGRIRNLVQEIFRVRVKHSRIVGYWVTELGALNHVFHIWEYDSLTARKAVRDALATDHEWTNRFLKQAVPAFKRMENCVSKPILGDFESAWNDQEFYKMLTVNYQGVTQDEARERFLGSARVLGQRSQLKGAFETVIGRSREFNLLQSAKSLDSLVGGEESFTKDPSAATYSKVLHPLQWTRWLKD